MFHKAIEKKYAYIIEFKIYSLLLVKEKSIFTYIFRLTLTYIYIKMKKTYRLHNCDVLMLTGPFKFRY